MSRMPGPAGAAAAPDAPLGGKRFHPRDPDAVRTLRASPKADACRKEASGMLHAERGPALRKQRGAGVEAMSGGIRRSWRSTRSHLRGLGKADREFRLVAMGRSLRKPALARRG